MASPSENSCKLKIESVMITFQFQASIRQGMILCRHSVEISFIFKIDMKMAGKEVSSWMSPNRCQTYSASELGIRRNTSCTYGMGCSIAVYKAL